jgi:hypothetical protein
MKVLLVHFHNGSFPLSDQKVIRVTREIKETRVILVKLGLQDHKEFKVKLVQLVPLDLRDHRVM